MSSDGRYPTRIDSERRRERRKGERRLAVRIGLVRLSTREEENDGGVTRNATVALLVLVVLHC
jgi:hypothetical protein